MMARLLKLEQAANHKCILKRPEGPEAAPNMLRRRRPSGISPQEDGAPSGSFQAWQATRSLGLPTRSLFPFYLCLGGHLNCENIAIRPQKPPFHSKVHRKREVFSLRTVPGKDSDWPSLSQVPIPEPITVAVAGSHGPDALGMRRKQFSKRIGALREYGGGRKSDRKQKLQTTSPPFPWLFYNLSISLGCISSRVKVK